MQHTEPILKKNQSIWYIEYFSIDPKTGKRIKQFRETAGLNRIKDLAAREHAAALALNNIRDRLGYKVKIVYDLPNTSLLEAIDIALKIKIDNSKEDSPGRSYVNAVKPFKAFCELQNLNLLKVKQFTKVLAIAYRDYLRSAISKNGEPYKEKTINNYMLYLSGLFSELKEREYIPENPFNGIKRLKVAESTRRAFFQDEHEIIRDEIKKDRVLFLAHTFLYYCALRPIEIIRLKPKYFDFKTGIIKLPGSETKQKKLTRIITIADEIKPFLEKSLKGIKQDWYIFGENLEPHPTKRCGKNSISRKHRKIIKRLVDAGQLDESCISETCFYIWKDKSAFDLIDNDVDIYTLMRHFGHQDLNTTQIYFKKKGYQNEKIKKISLGFEE